MAFGNAIKVPFLYDFPVTVRLLLAVPLLIVAEVVIEARTVEAVRHFAQSGLLGEKDFPELEVLIRKRLKMRSSRVAEGTILILVIFSTSFLRLEFSGSSSTWQFLVFPSWKHQMLLNMIKIRYADSPVFLDVSSVISQYQIAAQINLGATIYNSPWSSSQSLGATGQYVDRPTITYNPIMGDKFARSMMTPLPPPAILSLLQGGYPVDLIFGMMVHEVNGIRNRFGGAARAQGADQEFYSLVEKMRKIQSAGAIGMRISKKGQEQAAVMILRGKRDPETESLASQIREMLGLNPRENEFSVVYGAIARNDKEIALLTRSVREVIIDLAASIEVPEVHVTEKRVSPTFAEKATTGERVPPLIRIQSSSEKPGEAFVSVRYRNAYFWIDDRDFKSKSIFSFLMFIFNLVETGEKGAAPVVTIPTG